MKIAIFGGSGLVGSYLIEHFKKRKETLLLFSRKPKEGYQIWDPEKKLIDLASLEGVDVVINLAGETILGRWTQKKKDKILQSRLVATRFLTETLLKLQQPPKTYIGASAIGYYPKNTLQMYTEHGPGGEDFLAQVCEEWENSAAPLVKANMRTVWTRFGFVLADKGPFKNMVRSFQLGLGGPLGSGKQILSWIAIDDLVAALDKVIQDETIVGPVNVVSPNSVSNEEMTRLLGKILKRPTFFRIPSFLLRVFLKEGADVFLSSCNVYPQKLLEKGLHFTCPTMELALKKYLNIK